MGSKVFSGIQPTGEVHVGNYVGAIRNWIDLQNEYESIYCIVDYHSITIPYEAAVLPDRVLDLGATLMACGLDPEKAILFVQSSVPEHTELTWLLTTITSIGSLERMTQFKDKSARQKGNIFAGLMNYPVLQTADIILYKADLVPVGEDQVQHLELAREIARRFNTMFGDLFPEPKALLTSGAKVMALNDPTAKMSKSVSGSYINIVEEPDSIRQKIRRAVTDPGPQGGEMGPGVKNLFVLLEAFAEPAVTAELKEDYGLAKLKYSTLKNVLAEAIVAYTEPIRDKRAQLLSRPEALKEILAGGGDKARSQARETLAEAREKMGFFMPVR